MNSTFQQQRIPFLLFLLLLACYSYVFPRWADPNQNSRLDMVVAIVEKNTFQIDDYVANTVDYAKVGSHYYSDKAPGAAFLGIPVYIALKYFIDSPLSQRITERIGQSQAFSTTLRAQGSGVYAEKVRFALAQVALALVVSAIPTALLGTLLYLSLKGVGVPATISLIVALGYALLTPAFAYANAIYGHQLSAALLFGVFYLNLPNRPPLRVPHLLLIGFLLGYSVISEYPSVLIAAILFVYTFYRLYTQKRVALIFYTVLSGGLVAAGWMLYNTLVFGGPLNLGYSHSELWTAQHDTGFMSLTLPHWDALWGMSFGLFRGLFILSPWLLLFVPGLYIWWISAQVRCAWWICVASIVAMTLFNASSVMWWGGYAIGPRYLLPAVPFMAFAAAFAFVQWQRQRWFRSLAALLFFCSALFTWGLTLADQAFPPDSLYNPLVEYALPNWQQGNIARNFGTLLGLKAEASLLPLLLIIGIVGSCLFMLSRKNRRPNQSERLGLEVAPVTVATPSHH